MKCCVRVHGTQPTLVFNAVILQVPAEDGDLLPVNTVAVYRAS